MHNAAQESGTLTADALTQLFVSACRKDDCSSVVDEPVRPLVKAGPEQAAVQSFTKAQARNWQAETSQIKPEKRK